MVYPHISYFPADLQKILQFHMEQYTWRKLVLISPNTRFQPHKRSRDPILFNFNMNCAQWERRQHVPFQKYVIFIAFSGQALKKTLYLIPRHESGSHFELIHSDEKSCEKSSQTILWQYSQLNMHACPVCVCVCVHVCVRVCMCVCVRARAREVMYINAVG